jgi:hypothetical protein
LENILGAGEVDGVDNQYAEWFEEFEGIELLEDLQGNLLLMWEEIYYNKNLSFRSTKRSIVQSSCRYDRKVFRRRRGCGRGEHCRESHDDEQHFGCRSIDVHLWFEQQFHHCLAHWFRILRVTRTIPTKSQIKKKKQRVCSSGEIE